MFDLPLLGYCRCISVQQGDCGGQLTPSVDMKGPYSGTTPIKCQHHRKSIHGGKCRYMQYLNCSIVTSVVHKSSQHSHTCTWCSLNQTQRQEDCDFPSLCQSPLLLPPHSRDRTLLQLPQHYRTGISIHNSWIWSLLMRAFTAVCPYRAQRCAALSQALLWSLSLCLCLMFIFLLALSSFWGRISCKKPPRKQPR